MGLLDAHARTGRVFGPVWLNALIQRPRHPMRKGHPIPSIEGPATFGLREEPPMTSQPSQGPVGALRARMIQDMRVRGITEKTRNDYIRNVRSFAAFIGRSPDTATAEDLRRFQLHQTQTGMQPPSINS